MHSLTVLGTASAHEDQDPSSTGLKHIYTHPNSIKLAVNRNWYDYDPIRHIVVRILYLELDEEGSGDQVTAYQMASRTSLNRFNRESKQHIAFDSAAKRMEGVT